MNFLAHSFLSGNDEDILLGNFFADSVKGNQQGKFRPGIVNGINLHRKIDEFTDKHPIVKQSIHRLAPKYGKFSGIVADIYYDHFLAAGWQNYHPLPLTEFASRCYTILLRNYQVLPPFSQRIFPFIMLNNWLLSYEQFKGLQRVFDGMTRRTGLPFMNEAVDDLKKDYSLYALEFNRFFPDIVEYVNSLYPDLNITLNQQ